MWVGCKDGTFPPRAETAALTLGRAVHAYVLEGPAVFESRFAFGGPINPKTNRRFGSDTKAYHKWAAEQGKPCLSFEERDQVVRMATAVRQNPDAVKWLDGEHEVTFRTKLDGMPVQCRCDTINEGEKWISDLKTTESLAKFRRSFIGLGYHRQRAIYRLVVSKVLDIPVASIRFPFVVVEKNPPYAVGIFELTDRLDLLGESEVDTSLARMRAVKAGAKPRRDPEGVQMLDCPEYLLADLELTTAIEEDF